MAVAVVDIVRVVARLGNQDQVGEVPEEPRNQALEGLGSCQEVAGYQLQGIADLAAHHHTAVVHMNTPDILRRPADSLAARCLNTRHVRN